MSPDTTRAWQLLLAWAGEKDRLGWWPTSVLDEYAGMDVLKGQLGLSKPAWSAMRALLQAARARDAQARRSHANPSRLTTLFHWGLKHDERLEDRFMKLRGAHKDPRQAFPLLAQVVGDGEWEQSWSGPESVQNALKSTAPPKAGPQPSVF